MGVESARSPPPVPQDEKKPGLNRVKGKPISSTKYKDFSNLKDTCKDEIRRTQGAIIRTVGSVIIFTFRLLCVTYENAILDRCNG